MTDYRRTNRIAKRPSFWTGVLPIPRGSKHGISNSWAAVGATPILALRTFGDAVQTAREEGAGVGQQTAYGVGRAISSVAIEKAFDGLSGLYGKSATQKWAKKFSNLFQTNEDLQKIAESAFNDMGEGAVESFLTDVANQLLKSSYNGKSVAENYNETELDRVKRNMIINTIIGILFGDKAWTIN